MLSHVQKFSFSVNKALIAGFTQDLLFGYIRFFLVGTIMSVQKLIYEFKTSKLALISYIIRFATYATYLSLYNQNSPEDSSYGHYSNSLPSFPRTVCTSTFAYKWEPKTIYCGQSYLFPLVRQVTVC